MTDQTLQSPENDVTGFIRGPGMFYLSLLFLAILATMMVLWIDVPRVVETGELLSEHSSEEAPRLSAEELAFEETAFRWGSRCGFLLLVLWPIFITEQVFYKWLAGANTRKAYWWVFCLIPPLRLCAHQFGHKNTIWLPRMGMRTVDRKLRQQLERIFSIPMIWIALLILPVLGLQFYFKERIVDYPSLRLLLHVGTGLIWFAFTVEFIVMVSVADSKFRYCRDHWLDLVIILLPLISFLRTLRVMRAASLLRFGKLQQLTKVVRVYRLRGVAMRGLRALMLLDVLHRLLRTKPTDRLRALEAEYEEKRIELDELAERIEELRIQIKQLEEEETQAAAAADEECQMASTHEANGPDDSSATPELLPKQK